jgi:isopentenyl diphosphate isomerase/L-lactate dehydrogenase-like FMN-dependent dehydrogenase
MEARRDGQKVFFQIYLNKDRKASEVLLEKVTKLGASAIIFTVDAAWKSKRTRDVRAKTVVEVSSRFNQSSRRHENPYRGFLLTLHTSRLSRATRPVPVRLPWASAKPSQDTRIQT